MILQGVGHPVPYLGVSYANDPQKGGYMAYAPALDLTTLFEVIFAKHFLDIVTTYNDEICYVKYVLAPFYVFFTLFGCLGGEGGLPRGLGHTTC